VQHEKNKYFNESLADLVRNVSAKERISEYQGALIQNINPVFQPPIHTTGLITGPRFLSPKKIWLAGL
jgi:hypothetical protein